MDSSILADPAFKLVAADLDITFKEVIGCCFLLWLACYERRSKCFTKVEADIAAEQTGFADALIRRDLGDEIDGDLIEIHGVDKRISFLEAQGKKGRKGGKSSGKSRRAKREANASGVGEATGDAGGSKCFREGEAYSPTPDQSLTPSLAFAAEEFIEGFNRYFGKKARAKTWQPMVAKALKAGFTAAEIKAAAWGCHSSLDDEFRANVTPGTILRLTAQQGKNTLGSWLEQADEHWDDEKEKPWAR